MGSPVAVLRKGFENDLQKPAGYAKISWTVKTRYFILKKEKHIETFLVERWRL